MDWSIKKIAFFTITIFIFKICQIYYLNYLAACQNPDRHIGNFAIATGDSNSYLGAMENYFSTGSYFFHNSVENVYAGRLPHYALPYFVFRQKFNEANASDLMVLYQFIFQIIGIIALCLLVQEVLKSKLAFWIMCLLLMAETNWSTFTYQLSPESLSISFLSIFCFTYWRFRLTDCSKYFVASSGSLCYLVVLKPYFSIIYLFVGLDILRRHQYNLSKSTLSSGLFSIILLLALIPWTTRNYGIYEKFIPFQVNTTAGYNYSKSDLAFRKFVTAWGGDVVYWEKTAAGCYFKPTDLQCEFELPRVALAEGYTKQDVEAVRNNYVKLQQNFSPTKDMETKLSFDKLTNIYKQQRPFQFYILSPLRLTMRFFNHSGSYYLPIGSHNNCYHWWQLIFKILQSLFYWSSLLIGFPALIYYAIQSKVPWIFPIIVVSLICLFPLIFRLVEWRYFRTIQPILFIGLTGVTVTTIRSLRSNIFYS